jgi:hypothetical protein
MTRIGFRRAYLSCEVERDAVARQVLDNRRQADAVVRGRP